MQAWKELYLELAEQAAAIDGIKWVDLWHNQIGFMEDEHRFPAPAVFFAFRTLQVDDMAERMQNLRLQIEVYLFYETFSDTYIGSINQQSALDFLDLLNSIHTNFHGTTGENFSEMRRVGFSAVDTGNAGNLYQVIFECTLIDETAKKVYNAAETVEMDIENTGGVADELEYDLPQFDI